MKPVEFKGHNIVYAKDQKAYLPLPAQRKGEYPVNPKGAIVTCWKPTFRERLRFLFGGFLWIETLTFWHSLQPVKYGISKKPLYLLDNAKD